MEQAFLLLEKYKYAILFPLAIFEGPILTVVTGVLVSMGVLNPIISLFVIVPGDVTGDTLYYSLGRYAKTGWLYRVTKRLGLTDERLQRAENFFSNNPHKAIPLSKIILGVGVAGLFLAGRSRFSFRKFIGICTATSILQCSAYLCLGYFFGHAYMQINDSLNYIAAAFLSTAIVAVLYFLIQSKMRTK